MKKNNTNQGQVIIAFTENHLGGGSNRYFIEAVNNLPEDIQKIIVSTNTEALSITEKKSLNEKTHYHPIPIYNLYSIYLSWGIYHKKYWKLSKIVLLAFTPLFVLVNLFNYGKLLLTYKPDLLFIISGGFPGPHSTFVLALLGKILGIKNIVGVVSEPLQRTFLHNIYYSLVKKTWDKIVVNCASIGEKFIEQGIPQKKLYVIFNGIEPVNTKGFSSNKVIQTIGYVGRIDQQKGLQHLIEGFVICLKKYPHLKLLIAGSGTYKSAVEDSIVRLHLQKNIELVGFVENVYDFFKKIDVFVFPSLHEGLPYSVMEAMNAQLPVIATNVGGIAELITNEVEGLIVNVKSSEEIAFALERLISQPSLAHRLSKSGYNKVQISFSMDRLKSHIEQLILAH